MANGRKRRGKRRNANSKVIKTSPGGPTKNRGREKEKNTNLPSWTVLGV
jgi:hypothetical protein